jgi:hypothetical protein
MGNFFHGWRRKTGLIFLVAALAIAGLWFRSFATTDLINFHTGRDRVQLFASDKSRMIWMSMDDPDHVVALDTAYDSLKTTPTGFLARFETEWRWQCCGFQLGSGRESLPTWGGSIGDGIEMMIPMKPSFLVPTILVIPYWSLVLLLTVASVTVLFSKSRRSNVASTLESSTSERT